MNQLISISYMGGTKATCDGARELELIEAAKLGDQSAFGELVDRYKTLVSSLAFSLTGKFDVSEDIAQETFVDAWRHLGQLRDSTQFRRWICKIARRATLRVNQKETRPLPPLREPPWPVDIVSPDPSPLDRVLLREEEALVWRALSRLPEQYRVPIVLYYRDDRSVENVAKALDLSEVNVKQRLLRGRRILQDELMTVVEATLGKMDLRRQFTASVLAAIATAAASPTSVTTRGMEKTWPARVKALLVMAVSAGVVAVGFSVVPSRRDGEAARFAGLAPPGQPLAMKAAPMFEPVSASARMAEPSGPAADSLPRSGSRSNAGRRIVELDFEDGRLPDIAPAGLTTDCPPRSGNRYCFSGEVVAGFLQAALQSGNNWFPYSTGMVLSFDYWVLLAGRQFEVQIGAPQADGPHYTRYIVLDDAREGVWTHVDLPLADAVAPRAPKRPLRLGDSIMGLSFVLTGGYRAGQALYVDNVLVWEP